MDFTVLGQGVMGLTSAYLLARAGHSVELVGERPALATTSRVACAVWLPIFIPSEPDTAALNQARVQRWARESYAEFRKLAARPWGVREVEMHRFGSAADERPDVAGIVDNLRERIIEEFPDDLRYVWSFTSFAIDMDTYLKALLAELDVLGVVARAGIRYSSLAQAVELSSGDVLLNCSGLGSAQLCDDHAFRPAKGVVLLHEAATGAMDAILSAGGFVIAPRGEVIALGAGYDENYESESPTPEERNRIFDFHTRWQQIDLGRVMGVSVPPLEQGAIRTVMSGLRPVRTSGIRLEAEQVAGRTVVHDYGHGGGGVTLSWGSAAEAVDLALAASEKRR